MPECPTCEKKLRTENGVKMHHKQVHGESIKGVEVECDNCLKKFRIQKYRTERSEYNYCSTECQYSHREESWANESHPNWSKKSKICENCGEEFLTEKYRSNDSKFCSLGCYHESMETDSPNGYGHGWIKSRRLAREKFDHKCKLCQNACESKHHHVHHIIPVREFEEPSEAHFQSNLVLLCDKHHPKVEKLDVSRQCEILNIPQPEIEL